MTTQFGERQFALGRVVGMRAWRVNDQGVLVPLSYTSEPWNPGENLAKCMAYPSEEQMHRIESEDWAERRAREKQWRENHEMVDCKHGFYAYYLDVATNSHIPPMTPVVYGVIEGYGETLIGTKGFRCMKARVLALCFAQPAGIWDISNKAVDRIVSHQPDAMLFTSVEKMRSEMMVDAPPREELNADISPY